MLVTVTDTYNGKTIQYNVYENLEFNAFQVLVQDDFDTPCAEQYFFMDGEMLKPKKSSTLQSLNIGNEEVLILTKIPSDSSALHIDLL